MRTRVVECQDGSAVQGMVLHHIIADGDSVEILVRDLGALYRCAVDCTPAPPAPPPVASYADFVAWQRDASQVGAAAADVEHWRAELDGFQPLELPLDHARHTASGGTGARLGFELSAETTSAFRAYAMRNRAALPSAIAAVFTALLAAWAGHDEIVLGSALSGRDRAEFRDMAGFFVDTIALRVGISRTTTFRELLQTTTHEKLMSARAHQRAPFDQVVNAVPADRRPGRNPIFDVIFIHHGETRDDTGCGAVLREVWAHQAARFDLELNTLWGVITRRRIV